MKDVILNVVGGVAFSSGLNLNSHVVRPAVKFYFLNFTFLLFKLMKPIEKCLLFVFLLGFIIFLFTGLVWLILILE